MTTSTPVRRSRAGARPPGAAGPPRPRTRAGPQRRPLWMLLPGGVLLVAVIAVPLLVAVLISLLELDQYTFRQWTGAPLVGLGNYLAAWRETALGHAVTVSLGYSAIVTAVITPMGVAAALATQNRFRGRGLVRSVFLIPYVLPAFVVGTVWRIILQPDGVANSLLGLGNELWLNGPKSFWALVIVQIWSSWPLVYLLVLAGLQSVDPVAHEAAALDGAGCWTKLRYVIFPYLRGSIALGVIISFLHNVNNFTLPFVLFGVPSPHDVEVLPVLTYVETFQNFQFGLSAAMAVLSLLLISVPLAVYLRAVRLDTAEEGRTA
ncbi:MAG TPA: sugar ABC transporter permease [Actinophytocola sp.]|uniref:carbohydrate ABC transporter permease n=1 Tax=Actinophytocola sp. TaxID=1872138 RepID=UPI002DB83184|nr:sugar ABC transporter permease [Actinophytocola sp.]HEU5471010.1 sugar ABC transporter permease [Actinophytocola sp.]